MKCTGKSCSKLDQCKFKGIFLGYTSTDHNILYINLDSSLIKIMRPAQFGETWYLQTSWPPAAQLLNDLSVEADIDTTPDTPHCLEPLQTNAPYPPMLEPNPNATPWTVSDKCKLLPLPLWHAATLPIWQTLAATGARTLAIATPPTASNPCYHWGHRTIDIMTVADFNHSDMAMIYMSLDPYFKAFEPM